MANNRMFLVHKERGQRIYLAKYYPSTGWLARDDIQKTMEEAFFQEAFGHVTEEKLHARSIPMSVDGRPHALGGMFGSGWALEFDEDPSPTAPTP